MSDLRRIFLTPSVLLLSALFLLPLGVIILYSGLERGVYGGIGNTWTVENYSRLLDGLYVSILVRTFAISALATAGCLLLGFPLALFISRAGGRKRLYLLLVMLPFWTSFLVRTYAWIFLLRDTGLVNTLLLQLRLIHDPLPLLYNDGAILVGLIYGFLPFAVIPLFASLERLDRNLIEAASDLGSTPFRTLTRVVIPLCAPAIRAGALLVFIPCLGAYLTPDLLGGGKSVMIGNVIQNQFTTARDWPFGSAVSLVLMALVMLLMLPLLRRKGEDLL